jgi:hypothetical protein
MSLIIRDDNKKYILNWNTSTNNLELLTYELVTWNPIIQQYDKTLTSTMSINGSLNGQPIYGSWYDNATQSSTTSNTTPMKIYYGSGNGITMVDNSKLQVEYSGTYNIQFSAIINSQFIVAGENPIFIWIRKNTTDVSWSSRKIAIQGGENVSSFNFVIDLEAEDYVQIMYMWTTTLSDVYLKAIEPSTIPGSPSVIITMWKL